MPDAMIPSVAGDMNMSSESDRSKKGFSLVEVMVALCLLTFGMLAVSTMLTTSSELSRRSNQNILGDAIALELVETVKSRTAVNTFTELGSIRISKLMPGSASMYEYQDTNLTPTTGTSTAVSGGVSIVTNFLESLGTGRGYVYKWHLENPRSTATVAGDAPNWPGWPPNMLKLEVTVGWSPKSGATPADPALCTYKAKVTTFIFGSNN
jgi:prepilin-type N-terminal cleavage/methylation domain-containing protein